MQRDNSIAILPFVNMSSDPENEYFSDGITEEIINALAKIKHLNVTSRTSAFYYKGKNIPLTEIGQKLNVSTILEGSVRLANDTVRITAQLINTKDDFHFWSETWDRKLENIFAIQDEISLIIAEKLRENIGHFEIQDQLVEKQTDNIEAYECYLKAKYHFQKWNPTDIKLAIIEFEKAIELDQNHAESYIGLSDCFTFLAGLGLIPTKDSWEKAVQLSNTAAELNDQSPEVYYTLANIGFWVGRNFRKSFLLARKALELKPSFALAHQFLSLIYLLSDKKEKSIEHIKVALYLDPLSSEIIFAAAYVYYMLEDYNKALPLLDECLKENPKNVLAHIINCCCLLMLNRPDEVINYFDSMPTEALLEADQAGLTGIAYLLKGDTASADKCREELTLLSKTESGFRASAFIFLMHVTAKEYDKAFEWVDSCVNNISTLLVVLYSDPLVNNLKSDERYPVYQKKLFDFDFSIEPNPKKRLIDEETTNIYYNKLLAHIEKEKPYLDSNLSLRNLAKKIDINSNQLSWVINEKYGKNFNEFVNDYRVETFKIISADPKNAHITLIGLAYESGFNSKTVFNTYFKKSTGLTPNQFLKKVQADF